MKKRKKKDKKEGYVSYAQQKAAHASMAERGKKKKNNESVNEISKNLATKYIGKASRDAYFKGRDQGTVDAISAVGGSHPQQDYKKSPERKAAMRMRGIDRATKRLAKKEGTEMSIREKLMSLFEGDRAAHYKGATEPEPMHMKSMSSKGAMDMLNTPKSTEADGMKAAKDTADNIKKSAPGKKLRKGDQNKGDLTIKPSATPVKDPSAKMQTAESTVNEDQAYHKKMAFTHSEHGAAHESEVTNGGSADHDYASDHHHAAADAHKAAADAHKKHGGDSKQYKSAASAADKATGEAHETSKDAGKIKRVSPSPFKFPKKPSMKKEEYGIAGNKVADSLLDAIEQVTKEGSIKGSGTDRKAVLKKAFRAGEDDTRRFYSGKKPTIKPPKGMRDLKKFDAKHKDKGIQKAFAGGRAAGDGDTTIKGKARMKPQSNLPLNKYQRQGIKIDKKDKADTAAYLARTKGK